jgi:hypothetical protein
MNSSLHAGYCCAFDILFLHLFPDTALHVFAYKYVTYAGCLCTCTITADISLFSLSLRT